MNSASAASRSGVVVLVFSMTGSVVGGRGRTGEPTPGERWRSTAASLDQAPVQRGTAVGEEIVASAEAFVARDREIAGRRARDALAGAGPCQHVPERIDDLAPPREAHASERSPLAAGPIRGRDEDAILERARHEPRLGAGEEQIRGMREHVGAAEGERACVLGEAPVVTDEDADSGRADAHDRRRLAAGREPQVLAVVEVELAVDGPDASRAD